MGLYVALIPAAFLLPNKTRVLCLLEALTGKLVKSPDGATALGVSLPAARLHLRL